MPEVYEDKYIEELKKAQKEARSLPSELEDRISSLIYLGVIQNTYDNFYFYKDDEGAYYYDTDASRRYRKMLRERRLKRYAKN